MFNELHFLVDHFPYLVTTPTVQSWLKTFLRRLRVKKINKIFCGDDVRPSVWNLVPLSNHLSDLHEIRFRSSLQNVVKPAWVSRKSAKWGTLYFSTQTDFYPYNICWPTGVKTGTRNAHIMLVKKYKFREHRRGVQVAVICGKFL